MKKLFIYIFMAASFSLAYGFDEGFIWALKANFNGTATMPSISQSDLNKIGAAYMKGSVGYTMDGEAELGYLFGSERWFNGMDPAKFSGMSVFGSLGVGSGFAGQIAGNTIEGVTANAYINVSYAPVISFGVGTKAYFLNSRLALGLHIGGKLIADTSPEYLAYFDSEMPGFPEIGEIIVTDFMIKNMNPVMFSIKFMIEYNQPVNDRVEVILGAYTRFNVYSPKYITMPDSLFTLMQAAAPNFTMETPLKSYYINSLDFGITLGLAFKG
ncbi:hypothetical protein [Brachyspira murdochii]|uniref:Uncharacterized protein n=1 Tax=Brachyspira murdochii (strain ATCC 51284 / DSM 12563 / 56-150) TaxID=526224 RepID=D5U817_BRAM5|nr:hypothetical protein [Brachyspira murdochii]ADG70840.1 conserved hypothetical protein [Brachyspira murdochii DSM 12563]